MPAQDAFLRIKVVDEKGATRKPGTDDHVQVNGADIPYQPGQEFLHLLTSGVLALKVQYKGFAELPQWFNVVAPSDRPECNPFWPGTDSNPGDAIKKRPGYLLECMSLARTFTGKGTASASTIYELTVTLHPTREYVALIGTDYYEGINYDSRLRRYSAEPGAHKSGLPFRKSAHTYAQHLYFSKAINVSSPVTLLDCERGDASTWLRARNGMKVLGYRAQAILESRKAASWGSATAFVNWLNSSRNESQYITGHYAHSYLDNIGRTRPGTVQNYSVFSHAWHGGPILFNTLQTDPADFDLRTEQFTLAPLTRQSQMSRQYPQLPAAFTPVSGEIHIWGCFATELFKAMVLFIRDKPTGTREKFSHPQNTVAGLASHLTRAEVVTYLKDMMANETYMSHFAQFARQKTYGGPPGWGADVGTYDSIPGISQGLKNNIDGSILYINLAQNRAEAVFQRSELGSRTFDAFKYMCYPPS